MPILQQEQMAPYSAAAMFALVADVDSYTDFLPGCTTSRTLQREGDTAVATLTVTGGGFSQSFTTRNHLQYPHRIDMQLVNGPFRHLNGTWEFIPQSNGSLIRLRLEFELTGHLLAIAFHPVMQALSNKLTQAFLQRAHVIYGPPSQNADF